MNLRQYALDGGMSLSAVTTDRFKTACLTVSAAVNADGLLSPMNTLLLGVLGRGTATYPSLRALNRRMDMLYDLTLFSRNDRMGDLQILGSGAYFLDPVFLPRSEDRKKIEEENVRMLMDSLYAPLYDSNGLFRQDYTESEKRVQCDVIRNERNQPGAYAEQRSRELTFSSSPHGVSFYGTTDGVEAMTREALTARYGELFPHIPLRFFYVGSSDGERVAELIDRVFRDERGRPVSDGTLGEPLSFGAVQCPVSGPLRLEESLPVSQGKLVMLFHAGVDLGHADLFTAMVYNEIFGGSPLSKLFVNVREKKSLCYYCSSMFDFYKGYFAVASGIRCENREAAEEEILGQAEEMRRGNISNTEFHGAVRYLVSIYEGLDDNASAIENYYFSRELYGICCSPRECVRRISAVTKEDVVAFASRVSLLSVYFLRGTRSSEDIGELEYGGSDKGNGEEAR